MSSVIRSVHFYRKVPKELTESTSLGGAVSLLGVAVSLCLVYCNTRDFLTTGTRTDLKLDGGDDELIGLHFKITMERLPCRFTSVDLFDETGTKRLNITSDIQKQRVSSDGEFLGDAAPELWTEDSAPEPHPLLEPALPKGEGGALALTAETFDGELY